MKNTDMCCVTCGTVGPGRRHTPGSFLIEVVLWCMMIAPGLLYSLWRISARRQVCAACGAGQLVPTSSPVAQRLAQRSS